MKILVVDDSDLDRKLLVSTLEKAGVQREILEANDGKLALDLLDQEHQQLSFIFLDWQLPHVDGLEILKQLAQNPNTKHLPVIMLTSASSPESEELAQMLNPNLKAFLMKPLDPQKIQSVIDEHFK